MGVIAKGIPRGGQGLFTPVSLGYPLSVFNQNSTLKGTLTHLTLVCWRVEFLLKTDSGYPKDTGVTSQEYCPSYFLNFGSTSVPGEDYEQNGVDKKRGRVMLNRLGGRKRGELYGGREAEIARSLKNTRIRNPEIEDQQRVRETT